MRDYLDFLPVSKKDMENRGWDGYDFLLITGDAYVDHPSFGTAVIGRVLEAEGYRVAILAQPDWRNTADFKAMGRPRLGVMIGAGNLDSMVAHYTAAKKKRSEDFYSPGKKAGLRPDRATIVYSNRVREAFPDIPIIIGGLEASLRRFAHYDYWEDKVRRAILIDAKADLITYGMGETASVEIAKRLKNGVPASEITDVRGTGFVTKDKSDCVFPYVECPSYEAVAGNKRDYAAANKIEYDEHDPVRGKAVIQPHGDKLLVINPPAMPLSTKEFDRVSELPYTRDVHPMYEEMGGVPAIEEVKFSITHNRGCFGGCNFCALAFHQGRTVRSRSIESVTAEAEKITHLNGFKGYIHDIGGPTANFRYPACKKQLESGVCPNKKCLVPQPCKNLEVDHSEYIELLRAVEKIPGIKKVFIRSGIRFDYLIYDKNDAFFKKLVRDHVSGQLKVAPEHCCNNVLALMGKPDVSVYDSFRRRFFELTESMGKEQYLVPYLISSHPGSTLSDAVELSLYLKKNGYTPEQVQDFYPTPGTASTVMYYTGINPFTGKKVYSETDYRVKLMQRALLQWNRPENANLVREALVKCQRTELIGFGPECLVRPENVQHRQKSPKDTKSNGERNRTVKDRKNPQKKNSEILKNKTRKIKKH